MDYSKMLKAHKAAEAVCTVATITVSYDEASRFGICNTNEEGFIYEFEEKPKKPKNNQASMGIYIFNTDVLIKYLEEDEEDKTSSNDFGKNVIPNLLKNNERLYSYNFTGYWKDVGTISSLWEANMDLISENPALNLLDTDFRISSRNFARAPQFIGTSARINNSLVSEGSKIYGNVENSVLSGGVFVGKNATVKNSVILDDVVIEENAEIYFSIVDANSRIASGVKVGNIDATKNNITVIAKNSEVIENISEGQGN
jgi:glucose-1-phosphate adenylyltransferase